MGNISTNGTITAKSFLGNATSASKVNNALTIQANGSSLGSFDGSSAKTFNITYSNVGAAAANHSHSTLVYGGEGNSATSRVHVYNAALTTGGWAADSCGYKSTYGTTLDVSGYSTWYHRLAFNTDSNIDYYHGINTTTMSYVGRLLTSSNYSSYALPLTGGTTTGAIHVKDTKADMKQTSNNTSSTMWGQGFRTLDKNDLLSFWIQPTFYSSGQINVSIGARNYDTSGNQVANSQVNLVTQKNGDSWFEIRTPLVINSASYGSSLPTSNLTGGRVFYKLI